MVDGAQIYGDGVNVAARLESLADPGGIYISAAAHDQIKNKLPLGYEDLGPQSVKNIAETIRVFRVLPEAGGATTRKTRRVARKYVRRGAFSAVGLAIIIGTIVLVQNLSLRPPTTTASIPQQQKPALPLPNIPSIAVLPFSNLSGDRDQEYFSDGITNDLVTSLSRSPGLFVIDRASTFTYKGKQVKVQEVSRELGVKYVLEGGVQKSADQVRVTAQLVDATSGAELWAEHYDRPMKDIFPLQDEIVRRIVTTTGLQLTLWEQHGVLMHKRTDNLEAYDDLLRGAEYSWSNGTKSGNEQARLMYEKAIELDPNYTDAYSALGWTYYWDWNLFWSLDPHTLERALELAQKTLALDDSHVGAHILLGCVEAYKGHYEQAVAEEKRAIALDPNRAAAYFWLGHTLFNSGKPAESIAKVEQAMRLDPRNRDNYLVELGYAYSLMGRDAEAIPLLKKHLAHYPDNMFAHLALAAAYSSIGREDEARAEALEVMRISPQFSLEEWAQRFKDQNTRERVFADLRKAGLK
jgi:adenylate cyclase